MVNKLIEINLGAPDEPRPTYISSLLLEEEQEWRNDPCS